MRDNETMSTTRNKVPLTVLPVPLLNGEKATFECSFGRGCEGSCCRNGRPGLRDEEQSIIKKNFKKIAPYLSEKARKLIEKTGLVTKRVREGLPLAPVIDGWCVFFNEGCALHKAGAIEGNHLKYKPEQCAIFPLLWTDDGDWYVRQWHYQGEQWNDLFCLNPKNSQVKATESLKNELNLVATLDVKKAG